MHLHTYGQRDKQPDRDTNRHKERQTDRQKNVPSTRTAILYHVHHASKDRKPQVPLCEERRVYDPKYQNNSACSSSSRRSGKLPKGSRREKPVQRPVPFISYQPKTFVHRSQLRSFPRLLTRRLKHNVAEPRGER